MTESPHDVERLFDTEAGELVIELGLKLCKPVYAAGCLRTPKLDSELSNVLDPVKN